MPDVCYFFGGKIVILHFIKMIMRICHVIIIVFLFFIACVNEPFSPLVGKWQLKSVEKNGVMAAVDTVWYNFQSQSIFSFQIYEKQNDRYLYFIGMRTQEDKVVSIEILNELIVNNSDWDSIRRSFTIDNVNRKRLILRSEEGYLYSFIKF